MSRTTLPLGVPCLIVAAACVAGVASVVHAAEPLPIGLIDVDRIFKTHQPFLKKLEPIKAEVKELDESIQVRQAELETVASQARKAQPGSADSLRLQQQALKLQTELQQHVATSRQAVQKKEAAVLIECFQKLDAQVGKYAKARGLKLVIKNSDTSLDANQPFPEVLKALNRGVLYAEDLDITDEILKALDAASSGSGVQR
jgi:Skp family chaperone for outer membrane proteins